ncbi:MAG: Hpt domain-containing protein [Treponema sp.]|jgi:HPt (histidine-containing phosphotransfer) domain-containing protein|nr:Hpt domain-containing protein [Treponema sp.]
MDLSLLYHELIRIDGLDIWEGLSHVGGDRQVYAGALRLFCGEAAKKNAALAEALENDDWKAYAQAVHAVKGALAGVGAWELAQGAAEAEDACRRGDYQRCRDETGEIVGGINGFIAALKATVLFVRDEEPPREHANLVFLRKKLEDLKRACSTGSSGEADILGRELKTKTFDAATDALVEKICGYVENLDYDLALKAMEERAF